MLTLLMHVANAQSLDSIYMNDRISKQWQTDTILSTPESVLYDSEREQLYVSNMSGPGQAKNGKGYISKLGLDGKIVDKRFIDGLHSPKGMALYEGKLYVTDIDAIKVFSLKDGSLLQSLDAHRAEFLNDIAVTSKGHFYTTDMYADRIYHISEKSIQVHDESGKLSRPNGIYAYKGDLYVGNQNCILKYQKHQNPPSKLKGNTKAVDGLHVLSPKRFITSDWKGRLFLQDYGNGDHKRKKLLDTRKTNQRVADMTYIPEKQMVIIPTFSGNCITAYKLAL